MAVVSFCSADRPIPIKNRNDIRQFIFELFRKEHIDLDELTFIFCSDDYLLQINKQHLNHDFYTDVISFPFSNTKSLANGEIYISTERTKENAKTYGETYQDELLRVMIHGALHLCGYSDKTTKAKKEMRTKEDFYLRAYLKRFT